MLELRAKDRAFKEEISNQSTASGPQNEKELRLEKDRQELCLREKLLDEPAQHLRGTVSPKSGGEVGQPSSPDSAVNEAKEWRLKAFKLEQQLHRQQEEQDSNQEVMGKLSSELASTKKLVAQLSDQRERLEKQLRTLEKEKNTSKSTPPTCSALVDNGSAAESGRNGSSMDLGVVMERRPLSSQDTIKVARIDAEEYSGCEAAAASPRSANQTSEIGDSALKTLAQPNTTARTTPSSSVVSAAAIPWLGKSTGAGSSAYLGGGKPPPSQGAAPLPMPQSYAASQAPAPLRARTPTLLSVSEPGGSGSVLSTSAPASLPRAKGLTTRERHELAMKKHADRLKAVRGSRKV